MTNNEIITELYKTRFVRSILEKHGNEYYKNHIDDLEQDIYMQLLEMDNAKLEELWTKKNRDCTNQLFAYIVGIVRLGQNSKTSPFYYKYLKHGQCDEYTDQVRDVIDKDEVPEAFVMLSDEEVAILKYYANSRGSILDVARELGKSYGKTREILNKIKSRIIEDDDA